MMALARTLGWLSPAQEQAEFLRMIADRMARDSLGKNEVDLVCATHQEREPGAGAATAGHGRGAARQRGALGRAGLPGQRRGPRTHRCAR